MKRLHKMGIKLLGGLLLMTILTGCGNTSNHKETKDNVQTTIKSKAPRTAEETAVESKFGPLFDFLEQEDKDFSKVAKYSAGLSVKKLEKGEYVVESEKRVVFRELPLSNSGEYQNIDNGVDKNSKINIENIRNINKFLSPVIPTKEFKKLKIFDVLAKHPETELSTITYKVDTDMPLIKEIMESYRIEKAEDTYLHLSYEGDSDYSFLLDVSTKNKSYTLILSLKFDK